MFRLALSSHIYFFAFQDPNRDTLVLLRSDTCAVATLVSKGGSRILKWGLNFCNNVREIKYYFNIWGIRKKKKKKNGGLKMGGENSPISPPLDPRLVSERKWVQSTELDIVNASFCNLCALALWLALHILATQCWWAPTRAKQLSTVAILLHRFLSCWCLETFFT